MTLNAVIKKMRIDPMKYMAQRPTQMVGFWLSLCFTSNDLPHYSLSEAMVIEGNDGCYMRRSNLSYPLTDVSITADDWEVLELPVK